MDGGTTRRAAREQLVSFLRSIQRPDVALEELGDDNHLVDAGVIDSLAVLQVVVHLEEVHGVDLVRSGVDPATLTSLATILDVVERAGR